MSDLKKRLFEILEAASDSLSSKIVGTFIMVVIILNVFAFILETVESLSIQYGFFFASFEIFSVAVFTIEYALRLWSCTTDGRFSSPVTGRIRFAKTPLAVVDLIAILPFYLPLIFPVDARFVRILRLLRLFRLLKIARYSESLKTFGHVLKSKKEQLAVSIFVLVIVLLFVSTVMYFVEHEAQPKAFASIPDAMWWGVVTMGTVGYGDVVPITALGKFVGGVVIILAIGFFALPVGVIFSGFLEQAQKKKRVCPRCGKRFE